MNSEDLYSFAKMSIEMRGVIFESLCNEHCRLMNQIKSYVDLEMDPYYIIRDLGYFATAIEVLKPGHMRPL